METTAAPPCAFCGEPVYPEEPEPAQAFMPSDDDASEEILIVHARCVIDLRTQRPDINPA